MEEAIKYKNVIREYFLEYKNRDQVLRSIFYVILFGASFSPFVFGSAKEGLGYIWLTFPMALALFAAITYECPADDAVSGSRIEKAARGIYPENVKG